MQSKLPLVSVCMPAYNAELYISEAITSIINQTYQNWELLIVNDGSTDRTATIAASFNDPRVKLFQQENKGQCAAANQAFAHSKGTLIKFFDADDILSPGFIENQVNRIGIRTDAVVSAAWGRFYNNDISTIKIVPQKVWEDLPPHQWLIYSWENGGSMMQCGLWLIPREIINKAGLWDESLSLINDLDFFTRVILSSTVILFEKNALLYYRSGINNSLSGTSNANAILSAYTAITKATSNLLKVHSNNRSLKACANVWQQFVYNIYPQYPELCLEAQKKINAFGGSSIPFPSGGLTKILVKLIGWKNAKRVKRLLQIK